MVCDFFGMVMRCALCVYCVRCCCVLCFVLLCGAARCAWLSVRVCVVVEYAYVDACCSWLRCALCLVCCSFVAVIVVPLTVLAVVPPIAGGADKSNVPPKVRLPELVTVPDKVIPETVPVPLTDETVPVAALVHAGIPLTKVKT